MPRDTRAGRGKGDPALRLLVIDDQRAFAEALCVAMEREPAVGACRAAAGVDEGFAVLEAQPWDVVVLDAHLTGADGIAAALELRRRRRDVRIVLVTGRPDLDLLAEAAAAGIEAFLSKEASLAELREAITSREAADLGSAGLLAEAVEEIRRREAERPADPPVSLTPREREVLALLAAGCLLKDIAPTLGITVETCRGYVKGLLLKLGARSQLQAVVKAARIGLLAPETDRAR